MIKHIVMWNVRGDTPQERAGNVRRLKAGFEALRGRIPGMSRLEIGVNTSGVDYACDLVLYSEFEDQAALDGYASHPEHLDLRSRLGDLRLARHQVDYEAEYQAEYQAAEGVRNAAGSPSMRGREE